QLHPVPDRGSEPRLRGPRRHARQPRDGAGAARGVAFGERGDARLRARARRPHRQGGRRRGVRDRERLRPAGQHAQRPARRDRGPGRHRRDHDHAQHPAQRPQHVLARAGVRRQAAHRRGDAPLRAELRGGGPGQAPGRPARKLRDRGARTLQGGAGPADQPPAAVLLCRQRVQPGRPDRARRRLRLDSRHRRDGRGAAWRADGHRQPAGADDPRFAGAGPCARAGCPGPDDRLRPRPEELRLMARINLLPWRAERRKLRQKEFGVMLGLAALAGLLLWFLFNMYYNAQISGQNERNRFLQEQIAEVDKKIVEIEELDRQRARLLARKEVIEQLQANRSQMVHLFDSLVRTIPDGVILTTIKQEGEKLTLEGRSQSNSRVSAYMRNLEGSGWMTRPDLSIIEARDGVAGLPYVFNLSVQLANPNAPKDLDGDGIPDPVPPVDAAPAEPAVQAEPAVEEVAAEVATAPAAEEAAPSEPTAPDEGAAQ